MSALLIREGIPASRVQLQMRGHTVFIFLFFFHKFHLHVLSKKNTTGMSLYLASRLPEKFYKSYKILQIWKIYNFFEQKDDHAPLHLQTRVCPCLSLYSRKVRFKGKQAEEHQSFNQEDLIMHKYNFQFWFNSVRYCSLLKEKRRVFFSYLTQ